MQPLRILISGAGLGGLAAAASLLRAGHDVTVFEQAPSLGEVGAGIQVSANAARVLAHLGVLDAVEQAGALPAEYRFRTFDDGTVLQRIELGPRYRERHGLPYVSIHRADLHAILLDAVRALRPDAIRTGMRVAGFEEESGQVTLHFANGERVSGELAIGADGIRSALRLGILGSAEAEYTGDSAWRVMVPAEALPPEHRTDSVEIFVGPGRHCVVYPLRQGRLINLVAAVEQASWDEESWTAARPWTEMRDDFVGWNGMVNAIIDAAPRDGCFRWVLKNRRPVENWSSNRVTLLGDAAHPTLPYMAQGAAMALEDGVVLARAIGQEKDVAAALQLYQRNRIERTSRVVLESNRNRELFHLQDMAALRREFEKRNFQQERSAWLFSYDPVQVELV